MSKWLCVTATREEVYDADNPAEAVRKMLAADESNQAAAPGRCGVMLGQGKNKVVRVYELAHGRCFETTSELSPGVDPLFLAMARGKDGFPCNGHGRSHPGRSSHVELSRAG
jgi:hypothetical protein